LFTEHRDQMLHAYHFYIIFISYFHPRYKA